jgi:hypothetical protein
MASALFALVLGIGLLLVGGRYASLARRMRTWKSVPGRVTARAVGRMQATSGREGVWGEGGGHTPQVTYRYVVDGVEHESNKLAAAARGYKEAVAARKLAEIPDDVVVWYDPNKPSEAFLQKHDPTFGYVIAAVGLCLAGGAVASLVG